MRGLNETRHVAAADGTRIAYVVRGEGPALVFTNGFSCPTFYWDHLLERFEGRAQRITWDFKGHGRSEPSRTREGASIVGAVDDLRRVLDAAEVERAVLIAFSVGCQVILEAWRHIPDRIAALVPALGPHGRPFDTLIHPKVGPLFWKVFQHAGPRAGAVMLRGTWLATRTAAGHWTNQLAGFVGPDVSRETMQPFYDHFADLDPQSWVWLGQDAQRHSAEDLLPTIEVPTLVIAGGRDRFTPGEIPESIASRIPGAELVRLGDATHTGLLDEAERIGETVDAFLVRHALVPD